MSNYTNTMRFNITDIEKFREFFREIFPTDKEGEKKAIEKYGFSASASSWTDVFEERNIMEEIIERYGENHGSYYDSDDEMDRLYKELNKVQGIG